MHSAFLFFFLTSFLGSLPPGVVNMGIAMRVLERKDWLAWWSWAILAELPHVALAIWLCQHQMEVPSLLPALHWLSPLLLILVGWMYFRKHPEQTEALSGRSFFLLNLLNPAGVPFWWAALQTHPAAWNFPWFFQLPMAGLGAGLAFLLYIRLAGWISALPPLHIRRFYRFASIGFFLLGLFQLQTIYFP